MSGHAKELAVLLARCVAIESRVQQLEGVLVPAADEWEEDSDTDVREAPPRSYGVQPVDGAVR